MEQTDTKWGEVSLAGQATDTAWPPVDGYEWNFTVTLTNKEALAEIRHSGKRPWTSSH